MGLGKFLFSMFLDTDDSASLANRMRRRRFRLFQTLLETVPRPVRILDAGGTPGFWAMMGMTWQQDLHVVLLNPSVADVALPNFTTSAGDARDMHQFQDGEFDILFSNSVIEHVGDFADQQQMVREVRRVGKRYFLQTPNRYFPIEPHFFFPFFQFFPLSSKIWLIRHVPLGNFPRIPDRQKAREVARSIRLLTRKELRALFPDGQIFEEKLFFLTKSFSVYGGW
jgi:SAM-dependent methyltransferase